ncbi:hypothetical protein XO10_07060 [Marinitoga sp. 1135]|uniref:Outer membrane protein beta-barrel domain-containing protein n=1 Tax=Marinitoga piezophila (strain DSM 14283 / JCM 11233 / KA3) TaxID=443254 RepID=H2J3T7_MARPK|nr:MULTISPECIES: hypothetical protein [Marinitoga]AEX85829.1 hypothetical protein Marpi_1434 [Marinitoga piezophila KA3]APT76268.1 hypothetical protein LN42_07655 [Marinitoga sp. 1137]NUU96033.1 hypothetical protein [Marinitoga sp. 1135]NUU97945.1 hypothetical protein [Marinitoga sp. 1138]
MKKALLFISVLVLSMVVFSSPTTIVGAYGWTDIFIGFSGYGVYGGVRYDFDTSKIYDLKPILGKENSEVLDASVYVGGGLNYAEFDASVLGLEDETYGSFLLTGKTSAFFGTPILGFKIFGLQWIPGLELGVTMDYYFSALSDEAKKNMSGIALTDNMVLSFDYGIGFQIEPIEINGIYVKPLFFPWPLLLGAELQF